MKKPGYDSDIKLSSAGLIYCHFGQKIIKNLIPELNDDEVEKVFKKVYENFLKEIDGIDNGVQMFDGEPRYLKYKFQHTLYILIHNTPTFK